MILGSAAASLCVHSIEFGSFGKPLVTLFTILQPMEDADRFSFEKISIICSTWSSTIPTTF
jgi:hypothetical protein